MDTSDYVWILVLAGAGLVAFKFGIAGHCFPGYTYGGDMIQGCHSNADIASASAASAVDAAIFNSTPKPSWISPSDPYIWDAVNHRYLHALTGKP